MKKIRTFILSATLLLSIFSSSISFAQTYSDYVTEAKAITESLNIRPSMVSGNISTQEQELRERFKNALDFIIKVANDQNITKEQRVELIFDVSEDAGKFFSEVTAPYADLELFEFRPNPRESAALNFVNNVAQKALFFSVSVFKDLTAALPRSVSGTSFLDDFRRTRLINKMGSDIQASFKKQAEMVNTAEGKSGIAAISKLIEEVNPSEVMQYGPFHRTIRYAYIGLGVFFLSHAPIEAGFDLGWLGFTAEALERTTFGPMVAGINWFVLMWSMNKIRSVTGGNNFYTQIKGIANRIEKLEVSGNFSCKVELGGKK